MKRNIAVLAIGIAAVLSGCTSQEPAKPVPTPPVPVKPASGSSPDAAKPGDSGSADAHLGMMEKYALWKAKKEADEKLAKQLAAEEEARLRKFDSGKLPKHVALLAFEKKVRKELDDAAERLKGKSDFAAQFEKISQKQRKAIEAQAKILRAIDPSGGNSNIGTDHDVSLNLLANDYPEALVAAAAGDEKPLVGVRAELDKRVKKMESWLDEIRSAKK